MRDRSILLSLVLVLLLPLQSWAAITFSTASSQTDDSGVNTVNLTALNMPSGALAIMCVKWEATPTVTGMIGTGGDTFTLLTASVHSGTEPAVRCGYLLAATGNATYVPTITFSANANFIRAVIEVFTYTGTASFDVDVASTEADSDTTPSTNTLSTTGTDEVCVGAHGDFTTQTFSNWTVNGVAAGGHTTVSDFTQYYRILTATFSTGAGSLDRTATGPWLQRLSCFKTNAGGGGPTSPPSRLNLLGVS